MKVTVWKNGGNYLVSLGHIHVFGEYVYTEMSRVEYDESVSITASWRHLQEGLALQFSEESRWEDEGGSAN